MLLLAKSHIIRRAKLRPFPARRLQSRLFPEESEALAQHKLELRAEQRVELARKGAGRMFAHRQYAAVARSAGFANLENLRAEDDAIRIDGPAQMGADERNAPPVSRHDPLDQFQRFAELRSEEHTYELQSLMRISYAVCCLKKKKIRHNRA